MSDASNPYRSRAVLNDIAERLDPPAFADGKDLRDELAMALAGSAYLMLSAASYRGGPQPTRRDVLIESYRWADEALAVRRMRL